MRRWQLVQAVERERANLEAIVTLAQLLGYELKSGIVRDWRQAITRAEDQIAWVDTRLEHGDAFALWLMLEVAFPPERRSRLLDLKLALIQLAEAREIDLRGMGV